MNNFKIQLNLDISEIKFMFSSSIEEIDWFKSFLSKSLMLKYKGRFVGKADGSELELRVIHYFNIFWTSPILKGKIEKIDSNKSTVHFSYDYSLFYLIVIAIISIFCIVVIFDQISSNQYTLAIFLTFIIFVFGLAEIYNFRSKEKELKHFINKIFFKHIFNPET